MALFFEPDFYVSDGFDAKDCAFCNIDATGMAYQGLRSAMQCMVCGLLIL